MRCWQWQISTFFNRRYVFIQWSFFHCHVSFRECTPNATPSALRFLPDCFDALEKSVSTNGGFFSCDEIPLVGNITNLPQRKLWWNAILPYLLESPFRKMFTFIYEHLLKRTPSLTNPLGKLLNHKFLNSFLLKGIFFQGEIPLQFWGCSQPRVFQPKHRLEPETLRADMLLVDEGFVAAVVFWGKKLDG